MNEQKEYIFQVNIEALQSKTLDGREYYVVPVVMLKEGVWNGVFYSAQEIRATAEAWNGVDLLVNHPMTKDGEVYYGGTTPEIWERQGVGKVFNVTIADNGDLKAEAWFLKEKVKQFPALARNLHSQAIMEFSTGLFGKRIAAQNADEPPSVSPIVPDHLAVLPDKKGACSVADGCGGPRYNMITNLFKGVLQKLGIKQDEEDMFTGKLLEKIKSEYSIGENDSVYVENLRNEDETSGSVIFSIQRNEADYPEYFKQNFNVDENKGIEFSSDPTKMEKDFVEISNDNSNSNDEGGVDSMNKDKIINSMIEKDLFSAGYKDFLNGLSECQLGTLQAWAQNQPEPEHEEPDLGEMLSNVEDEADEAFVAARNSYQAVVNGDNTEPETLEDFVETVPEKFKDIINTVIKDRKERKDTLVNALDENERCDYSKEQLEEKEIPELETLSKLANVKVSYEANANEGGSHEEEDENEVPLPPKMNWGGENE